MRWQGKYLIWPVWLVFVGYSILFAPATDANTGALVMAILQGKFQEINWVVITLFNLMGVWPLIFMVIFGIESKTQRIPAWPFIIGSFFLGAFVLMPYFGLRNLPSATEKGIPYKGIVKSLDGRILPVILLVVTIGLVLMAVIAGDWADYATQFQKNGFVHVMSLDFLMFTALFPIALKEDLIRRNWFDRKKWILFSIIPLFGACSYLIAAPRLSSPTQ